MTATRLCFIRHGETDWNVERRIQGQMDIPLSGTGRRQAQAMACNAGQHEFFAIYSSDLSRASETANMLAKGRGIAVIQTRELRERHYGFFQGITAEEGKRLYPQAYSRYSVRDPDYDFENGESLKGFAKRVHDAVENLGKRHAGQTIAAVSHAGVLDILYRRATGRMLHAPRDFAIPNCTLNWFRMDDTGLHLEKWDDHHLSAVLTESAE